MLNHSLRAVAIPPNQNTSFGQDGARNHDESSDESLFYVSSTTPEGSPGVDSKPKPGTPINPESATQQISPSMQKLLRTPNTPYAALMNDRLRAENVVLGPSIIAEPINIKPKIIDLVESEEKTRSNIFNQKAQEELNILEMQKNPSDVIKNRITELRGELDFDMFALE